MPGDEMLPRPDDLQAGLVEVERVLVGEGVDQVRVVEQRLVDLDSGLRGQARVGFGRGDLPVEHPELPVHEEHQAPVEAEEEIHVIEGELHPWASESDLRDGAATGSSARWVRSLPPEDNPAKALRVVAGVQARAEADPRSESLPMSGTSCSILTRRRRAGGHGRPRSLSVAAVGLEFTSRSSIPRSTGRITTRARRPPSTGSRTSIRASVARPCVVGYRIVAVPPSWPSA